MFNSAEKRPRLTWRSSGVSAVLEHPVVSGGTVLKTYFLDERLPGSGVVAASSRLPKQPPNETASSRFSMNASGYSVLPHLRAPLRPSTDQRTTEAPSAQTSVAHAVPGSA